MWSCVFSLSVVIVFFFLYWAYFEIVNFLFDPNFSIKYAHQKALLHAIFVSGVHVYWGKWNRFFVIFLFFNHFLCIFFFVIYSFFLLLTHKKDFILCIRIPWESLFPHESILRLRFNSFRKMCNLSRWFFC